MALLRNQPLRYAMAAAASCRPACASAVAVQTLADLQQRRAEARPRAAATFRRCGLIIMNTIDQQPTLAGGPAARVYVLMSAGIVVLVILKRAYAGSLSLARNASRGCWPRLPSLCLLWSAGGISRGAARRATASAPSALMTALVAT